MSIIALLYTVTSISVLLKLIILNYFMGVFILFVGGTLQSFPLSRFGASAAKCGSRARS